MDDLLKKDINTSFLVKDLIYGDEDVSIRDDFIALNRDELEKGFNLIIENPYLSDKQKQYLITNSWRINYKSKPLTIDQFLTNDIIGPTADTLYPRTKEILTEYWKTNSPYRRLVMASAIGTGKSTMSVLSNLYIVYNLWNMRSVKKFFHLNQSASTLLALISFTMDKASQLLLQPFKQVILSSPLFKRVKLEEKIPERQAEFPNKIIWTTAGGMGSLQFSGDIHIMLASSPSALLGLNMISATLSEISFFIDKGFAPEYIWRIFNDARGRVYSRFENKYFATVILDSSPNDVENSPIDEYIFKGDAYKDPLNYIVTGSQWEFTPWKYPEWQEKGTSFPVFKGSSGKPAKVLSEDEIDEYNDDEIYNVPIDVKQLFIDNTVKSVKDYCGWPSGSQGKLIHDYKLIDCIFDDRLKNLYTYIHAPADKNPKRMIWDQVKDKFFVCHADGSYEFYRYPGAPRFIHVDQSETGDTTGIGVVHSEIDKKGFPIYVIDFTIAITPTKARINLEAIEDFIVDLVEIGHMTIHKITFDMYASPNTIQRFKRRGYHCEKFSVDSDPNPYYIMVSQIANKRLKSGKNLFLKNNLKSLHEVRKEKSGKIKIDHFIGKLSKEDITDNWDTSKLGYYAKDISDAVCGALWHCIQEGTIIALPYSWDDYIIVSSKNNIEEVFEEYLNEQGLQYIKTLQ